MNKIKCIFFLSVILLFANCSKEKQNFYVFNQDTEAIDSLHIFVGDRTFLIEDLQPRKTKGIRIPKMGGHKIVLQADQENPMPLSGGFLSPQTKGTIKIIMTKNNLVASGSYGE